MYLISRICFSAHWHLRRMGEQSHPTLKNPQTVKMQNSSQYNLLETGFDQRRIDLIKVRLAAIEADHESGLLKLRVSPLTDDELQGLPRNLPQAHLEFLKQIGALSLGYNDYTVIETFKPCPWEEGVYFNPNDKECRLPDHQDYLFIAYQVDGDCYGYNIAKAPYEFVQWDFAGCRPFKPNVNSFLELVEQSIFQKFPNTSLR